MVELISDYDKRRAREQDDKIDKILNESDPDRKEIFAESFRKFMGVKRRKTKRKRGIRRVGYPERKIEEFLHPKKLDVSEVNVLLIIFNPRTIRKVIKEYRKVNYIDKLWIKGHDSMQAWNACQKFVREHPEYTHIIITSDDIIIPPHAIPMLIDDILTYDFPVISGTCDACNVYDHADPKDYGCTICRAGERHDFINTSFKMVKEWDKPYLIVYPKSSFFQWIKKDYAENYPTIHQVWFSGLALGVIRRDILLKYMTPYRVMVSGTWIKGKWVSYHENKPKKPYVCGSKDLSLAVKLHKAKIPQFADFGAHSPHLGDHHTDKAIHIGKKYKKELIFETAIQSLKEKMANYVRPARILLCSMFNNEQQSIEKYMKALLNIDYPKKLIDLVWLENDSVDKTFLMLRKHLRAIRKEYDYHSTKLIRKKWGKKLRKISSRKFGRQGHPASGKNVIAKVSDAYVRGAKIAAIYNIFFDMLDDCHDFIVIHMGDIVSPRHILKRYLEVFRDYPDAGWVGGIHHKRFPLHFRFGKRASSYGGGLAGPLKIEHGNWAYMVDEELIKKVGRGERVFECGMTGHVWMMPRDLTRKVCGGLSSCEVVCPIIYKMWSMGYRVYCTLDVYLQHISLDGKIYRRSIYEERKFQLKIKPEMQVRLRRWLRKQGIIPMPTTAKEIMKLEEKEVDEVELQHYLSFTRTHYQQIPPRPRKGEHVMDNILKDIIGQERWDEYYGKWKKFILKGYK